MSGLSNFSFGYIVVIISLGLWENLAVIPLMSSLSLSPFFLCGVCVCVFLFWLLWAPAQKWYSLISEYM